MVLPPSRSRSYSSNHGKRLPSYHVSLGGGGGGSPSLSPSPSRTVSRLSFFLGTILVSALLALVTVAITLGGLPADRWHARRLLREHDPNAEVFEPNRRALKTHHDSDEGEYHSLAFQALNESAKSSVPKEDLNLPHEGRLWERYRDQRHDSADEPYVMVGHVQHYHHGVLVLFDYTDSLGHAAVLC